MKGKTVVITGGTSGIGEIAADRLAQMGARSFVQHDNVPLRLADTTEAQERRITRHHEISRGEAAAR